MTYGVLTLLETTTFPGWPSVDPLTNFELFMLCIGAPLLMGLVMAALVLGGGRRKELAAENRAAGLSLGDDEVDELPVARRAAVHAQERPAVTGGAAAAPRPGHGLRDEAAEVREGHTH
ncbi:MAG TPA: hypothetical protein H9987_09095 [Candidatus Luteococcus avicola]|nr:hypothetical protein [Candidatus Luteococcus avicola]